MTNRLVLFAHWSVYQKLSGISSIQLSCVALYALQLTAEDEVAGADDSRDDRLVAMTDEHLTPVDGVPASNRSVRGRRDDRVFVDYDAGDATVVAAQLEHRLTRPSAVWSPDAYKAVLAASCQQGRFLVDAEALDPAVVGFDDLQQSTFRHLLLR